MIPKQGLQLPWAGMVCACLCVCVCACTCEYVCASARVRVCMCVCVGINGLAKPSGHICQKMGSRGKLSKPGNQR